ncbi:AMP-binding protein [Nocardia sp. NBC_00565]|uniref:AMP-binding protein n=1 Tax=Nocardia sp. NBC_00565 TaxID=2975993 RepID=UPI002E802922|nr:AMP-binding protein [Nocardia sp. NBC_00565]WUC06759.1 AMP-binding protein [Nocardia sp. NBC_00565]
MDDRTILGALIASDTNAPGEIRLRLVGDRGYTAGEILARAAKLAGLLTNVGATKGDRIAIMMSNRIEFLDTFFAAAHIGALSVPLNTSLKGPILEHMLRDSAPAVLVIDASFAEVIGRALENTGTTARVLVIDRVPTPFAMETLDYASSLEHAAPIPSADVTRYDDACILYTSGTTGPSKGVLHTHNSIISFGEKSDWLFGYTATDVAHNCLPLFHANALCVTLLPALRAGGTVVFGQRFSASGFWQEIRDEGATVISILGAMVPILWGAKPRDDDAENNVRVALCVPTPSSEIYDSFEHRFGLRLVSQYGMTDTSSIIGTPPDKPGRPGYAGVAHPDFECVVVDEHDVPLPDGVAGELVVRPRKPEIIMSRYWNNAQATMETWRNLWFHTGDVLVREPDGWFKFIDRQKDAMRRFGENISSFEVESVVAMHPSVHEVAVYAVPSELSEDEVMAAIVLVPGVDDDLSDIGRYCDEHLPYFASPRYLVSVEQLPKTKNEKVLKNELRRIGITDRTVDRGARGRKAAAATQN